MVDFSFHRCCYFNLLGTTFSGNNPINSQRVSLVNTWLGSTEKRFAVLMIWSLVATLCLPLLFGLQVWFLVGTKVHSVELTGLLDAFGGKGSLPDTLLLVGYIDSSFCRISTIF